MTVRQKFAIFVLAGTVLSGGIVAVGAQAASAAPVTSRAVAATDDQIAISAAAALSALGTAQFNFRLDEVSRAAATRLEVDSHALFTAWAVADRSHQIALLSALTQVGVPYHRNSSKVGVAFDCSGLTAYAWAQSGFDLARHSSTQLRNAATRTLNTAQAGDLVYYPGHVMLWLGVDNLIVHAPYRGHPVEVGEIKHNRIKRAKFGDPTGGASTVDRAVGLA